MRLAPRGGVFAHATFEPTARGRALQGIKARHYRAGASAAAHRAMVVTLYVRRTRAWSRCWRGTTGFDCSLWRRDRFGTAAAPASSLNRPVNPKSPGAEPGLLFASIIGVEIRCSVSAADLWAGSSARTIPEIPRNPLARPLEGVRIGSILLASTGEPLASRGRFPWELEKALLRFPVVISMEAASE